MKKLVLILLPLLFFASCYYDNEEELYAAYNDPQNLSACDTFEPGYAGNLKEVFDTRCISCHGNGSGHAALLYDFSTASAAAGQYDLLTLSGDLNHSSSFTLDACEKAKLRIWDANPRP